MTTQGKVKQSARTAKGRIKEIFGRVTGNRRLTTQGKTEQVRARIKHAAEKGTAALKHRREAAKGKTQEIVGAATGNNRMKAKGKLNQASARISHKFNK